MALQIFLSLSLLVSASFAAQTPWQKKFDAYTKGLPKDAIAILQRVDECGHFGGEEYYSDARQLEIDRAMKRLKCEELDSDKDKILKKYKKRSKVRSKIQNFPQALETSDTQVSLPKVEKMMKIQKMINGNAVVIGELKFVDSSEGQLTILAPGSEGEALRVAWQETNQQASIKTKWAESDPDDKNGDSRQLVGKEIKKGAPDYPKAVADHLSRRYGYFVNSN